MSRSTQQQHKDAAAAATTAWSSESVYTKLAATPTAPNMSGHGHATPVKNAASLPFAIAVESPVFGQHPQALAPAASTAPLDGAHGGAYGAAPATPTSRPTTTTCRSKALCWISRLPLLLLFHACNFALGLAAFVLVVTLLPLSVGLLPLCCIGVVVFRITAWTTEWLAVLDVFLANLVRGSDDTKLRVHPRMGAPRFDASSAGDASEDKSMFAKLLFVSQRNLGAMLYFATLKFAVGVLSIVAAACATTGPVHAIVLPVYSDYELCGFTYDDHPVAYVFTAIGITLVGLLLLPAVASLSRQLTKHVCAADDSDTRVPVAAAPGMLV